MFIWPFIQFSIMLVILLLASTVVIAPFINKPLFWFFGQSERDLTKSKNQLSDVKTIREVNKINKKTKRINNYENRKND